MENEIANLIREVKEVQAKACLTIMADMLLEQANQIEFLQQSVHQMTEKMKNFEKVQVK